MDDDLLKFYNKELQFLQRSAADFAEANPKVAARLKLGTDTVEDPHVGRLIEAVAFMNARIRKKLDDDFPELTEGMLGVLYPHYLAPIPSMSIVQFRSLPDLAKPHTIPPGTSLETESLAGEPCQFRTAYPVELLPVRVEEAQIIQGLRAAPSVPRELGASAVLRIVLQCESDDVSFAALAPSRLRFYLKGQDSVVHPLYSLLFNNILKIAAADSYRDANAVFLEREALLPVGFERDEGLLPYPARSLLGYRLLTEYFAFPQKFLFVDLAGLEKVWMGRGGRLELFFYLDASDAELERGVSADTFALGCTPIVNLFKQRAEPITLTQTEEEYHVVPDARRLMAKEIYSIDSVTALSPEGERRVYRPFYGLDHGAGFNAANSGAYWHAARRPAPQLHPTEPDRGGEVFLGLVDLDFNPAVPADWVLEIQTTCLNRDLPARLPFGGGQPRLQLREGSAPLAAIVCLTAPTRTRRPTLGRGTRWRLISHLNLNYLSLVDGENGPDMLRELLRLYDFDDSPATRAMIDGVAKIDTQQAMAQVKAEGITALCRGLDVSLTLDEDRFQGQGLYLFASVMERFFALYAPLNSFTRLTLRTKRRQAPIKIWLPRAGEKILV